MSAEPGRRRARFHQPDWSAPLSYITLYASRVPGVEPGTALAAVATTGYLGFLAGPPVIGEIADVAGLRVALGAVSVLCALVGARWRAGPPRRWIAERPRSPPPRRAYSALEPS